MRLGMWHYSIETIHPFLGMRPPCIMNFGITQGVCMHTRDEVRLTDLAGCAG